MPPTPQDVATFDGQRLSPLNGRLPLFIVQLQTARARGRFDPSIEVKRRLQWMDLRRTGCPSATDATGRGDFRRPALVALERPSSAFLIYQSFSIQSTHSRSYSTRIDNPAKC